MTKRVYLFDGLSFHNDLNTNYNGFWDCQESPLEPNVFIVPVNSTEIEPPLFDGNVHTCTWDGTKWILNDIPTIFEQTNQSSKDQPTTEGTQTI